MKNSSTQTYFSLFLLFLLCLLILPHLSTADDSDCSPSDDSTGRNKSQALRLKIAAIVSILIGGSIGVCIPILGRWVPSLRPESDIFFIVKAFAAGVILATGFIHILPDAFDNLTSPCLGDKPWQDFPFSGFFAMVGAIFTLMVDSFATGFFNRRQARKEEGVAAEKGEDLETSVLPVHTHSGHGHAHGSAGDGSSELVRHRVISQVHPLCR